MPSSESVQDRATPRPAGWRLNAKNKVPRKHVLRRVDAFLCSYPKCGRTWLRFMLSNYINLSLNLGVEVDLTSMFSIFPNDCLKPSKTSVQAFAFLHDKKVPMVLASHRAYRAKALDGRPVIALLRSPNDVMWSWYCERVRKGVIESPSAALSQFLVTGKRNLHDYCAYINGWVENLPRHSSLIVTYNQLKSDAPAALARIAEFLKLPVIEEQLRSAVELSSLARMRALEAAHGIGDKDRKSARIRSGQIGEHAKSFSAEDLAMAAKIYRTELSDDAKSLLRGLNLLDV